MEYFPSCTGASLHQLKNEVRFGWFGDVDCIEFLIIHVYTVFESGFAHLAAQRQPVYSDTMLRFYHMQSLSKPSSETVQMYILNRTRTLAGSNKRIIVLAWI